MNYDNLCHSILLKVFVPHRVIFSRYSFNELFFKHVFEGHNIIAPFTQIFQFLLHYMNVAFIFKCVYLMKIKYECIKDYIKRMLSTPQTLTSHDFVFHNHL